MENKRKTTQFIAPLFLETPVKGKYNIYPSFDLGTGKIEVGVEQLIEKLVEGGQNVFVVDGYVGVFWKDLEEKILCELDKRNYKVCVHRTADYFKTPDEVEKMITPFLNGDDPVFGRITDLSLRDWFRPDFFDLKNSDQEECIQLIIGCGASLSGVEGTLVYVDLPKNELQFRMRAGAAFNLGADSVIDAKQAYKRYFFVDWVVLNHHKCDILSRIDYFIDGQHPEKFSFASGEDIRAGLEKMSRSYFRVRPWFEPGAWGGTWMRDHIDGLNKDVPNLAWSFELMVLENGLLFSGDGTMLELSFDTLMYAQHKNVLGKSADRFKYDFPIRFDFLDTFNGGNLSVQCHPRNEYIQKEFGMPFTQDETYYILDCQNEPNVYLGFQGDIDPNEFEAALYQSQEEGRAIDIEKYVQKIPARKHDLFLIPNGTIHGSGSDNLVLEISSAPYIFTFKMYDWMRLDLDGKPRPINIAHGMKNLYFDRAGDKVRQELISKPEIKLQTESMLVEQLPTHPEHFYAIERYTFTGEIEIETKGQAQVCMLVEGESVMLETAAGMQQRFNYAETFVVPAAAGSFRIINESEKPAKMVVSYVKDQSSLTSV